jgi:hypothetical protein
MTDYTIQQAEDDARRLLDRMESEPGFREAMEADPERTLTEAGLPPQLAADLATAWTGSDVEGFRVPPFDYKPDPTGDPTITSPSSFLDTFSNVWGHPAAKPYPTTPKKYH